MALLTPFRRLLKLFHPEGIPRFGTPLYNLLTKTGIFQRSYDILVQDILSYRKEGDLLDVGTGPGWMLIKLYRQSPTLRVRGIDISPAMVAKAHANVHEDGLSGVIEIKEGDACTIPYGDAFFDVVVSTGSIHHWKEPVRALNEIYRVLKDGGYALMYDVVSDTPQSVLKKAAGEFGRLRILLLWIHAFEEPFYSRKALEQLPESSLFRGGNTSFPGVFCCLAMRKES